MLHCTERKNTNQYNIFPCLLKLHSQFFCDLGNSVLAFVLGFKLYYFCIFLCVATYLKMQQIKLNARKGTWTKF